MPATGSEWSGTSPSPPFLKTATATINLLELPKAPGARIQVRQTVAIGKRSRIDVAPLDTSQRRKYSKPSSEQPPLIRYAAPHRSQVYALLRYRRNATSNDMISSRVSSRSNVRKAFT